MERSQGEREGVGWGNNNESVEKARKVPNKDMDSKDDSY